MRIVTIAVLPAASNFLLFGLEHSRQILTRISIQIPIPSLILIAIAVWRRRFLLALSRIDILFLVGERGRHFGSVGRAASTLFQASPGGSRFVRQMLGLRIGWDQVLRSDRI